MRLLKNQITCELNNWLLTLKPQHLYLFVFSKPNNCPHFLFDIKLHPYFFVQHGTTQPVL